MSCALPSSCLSTLSTFPARGTQSHRLVNNLGNIDFGTRNASSHNAMLRMTIDARCNLRSPAINDASIAHPLTMHWTEVTSSPVNHTFLSVSASANQTDKSRLQLVAEWICPGSCVPRMNLPPGRFPNPLRDETVPDALCRDSLNRAREEE